jgi:DNA-binding transcriptional MerR regulator
MRDTSTLMQIGELARRAGVSQRTIHYYESLGLLAPAEREGQGYRYYDGEVLRRLQKIDQLKGLGLTLDEIAPVLPLYFGDEADPTEIAGKRRVIALLKEHLAEADRRVAEMRRFRDEVAANIARLEGYIRDAEAGGATTHAGSVDPASGSSASGVVTAGG